MIEISTEFDEEIPKWDVALEALLNEEYRKLGRPLGHEDFRRLAGRYAIRFDDIMATLFELAVAGCWEYRDRSGSRVELDRERVDRLHERGRLQENNLQDFDGDWRPVE